ncbi:MAG TPA: endonuclease MutS2 [Anaerolineae bacterium]|nr:endonuclease MutS2 [Anaerolineae bacterium]HQH38357.1 endonuclease MutS2 [Anaerolineae bacterium]
MDRHWLTLEYPEILKRLAQYTDFSGGAALALSLLPTSDCREARERLALTREARAMLDVRPEFALGGVQDIRPGVEHALHGVTLQPADLLQVRDTLVSADRVRRTLTVLETQFPALADMAWRIHSLSTLVDAIGQVLDDRGEVRDHASPELARIRRDLRIAQDRIQDRLRRIITSAEVAPYLQEALITRREGRFVIPVQADFKGHVQGIVHDRSSSGATLFMEPTAIVELNNALRELALAEEEEIYRLLRALTEHVAHDADEITATVNALAEIDLTFAKARYAADINATEPELVPITDPLPAPPDGNVRPGTVVYLPGARHPLLDPATVVPVNVELDDETHILVITGPNTGGKTVSLKTVGLLTLMAQAGMHLPTEQGARLSCFETVVADIGDEQSIEQSLSTFSSHLTNIISFLEHVDHRALVLLDELGAGTDPAEGSALARALLDTFRKRRCTAFVATHYPELKLYAHSTPGVRNASMEFDVETLAPTYHLIIGLPGRSNAFAIARRLGLPEDIVEEARRMISGEELRADDMLEDLHHLRIQTAQARDEARLASQESTTLAGDLRQRLHNIEEERRAILRQAEQEAHAEVTALREEIRALRQRILATPWREAPPVLDAVTEELDEWESTVPTVAPSLVDVMLPPDAETPSGPIQVGDTVTLTALGVQGTVVAVEGAEFIVQAGPLRTRVGADALEKLHHAPAPSAAEVKTPPRGPSPGIQIDLRGQTVEEALERLDRYLDDAAMAALPWVRIIHGKGTGKLRREIRSFISSHPLVTSYESAAENEGGDGVTVAHLMHVES